VLVYKQLYKPRLEKSIIWLLSTGIFFRRLYIICSESHCWLLNIQCKCMHTVTVLGRAVWFVSLKLVKLLQNVVGHNRYPCLIFLISYCLEHLWLQQIFRCILCHWNTSCVSRIQQLALLFMTQYDELP